MGTLAAFALVATAAVGWLAERLHDRREARAAFVADIDALDRSEMLDLGWRSATSGQVEVLLATRPFSLPLGNGPVSGEAVTAEQRAVALSLVRDELERYPPGFLARARLGRILLCQGLRENATPIPSLPNYQRTLLLDADAPPDFLRRLLHHEVFHFADYAADDQVQRDPAWEALNAPSFGYGSGGRYLRDPRSSAPAGAPDGFVTRYATSALEEDKAETFAFLMVAPGATLERADRDEVLESKIGAVEAELERLDPAMKRVFEPLRLRR